MIATVGNDRTESGLHDRLVRLACQMARGPAAACDAGRFFTRRVVGDSVHSGMLSAHDHRLTATFQMRVAHPGRLTMTQTATDFPALESDPIEKLAIDTIRTLCMDAVQAA